MGTESVMEVIDARGGGFVECRECRIIGRGGGRVRGG